MPKSGSRCIASPTKQRDGFNEQFAAKRYSERLSRKNGTKICTGENDGGCVYALRSHKHGNHEITYVFAYDVKIREHYFSLRCVAELWSAECGVAEYTMSRCAARQAGNISTFQRSSPALNFRGRPRFGCPQDDVDAHDGVDASYICVALFPYLTFKLRASGELAPFGESPAKQRPSALTAPSRECTAQYNFDDSFRPLCVVTQIWECRFSRQLRQVTGH